MRLPEEGKAQAVSNLLAIVRDNSKDYLRMGAFQAMLGFAEDPEIIKLLEKAIEKEDSAELNSYFKYFLEMLKE